MDFESPDWQASIILRTRVGSGCSESISMYGSRDVGLLLRLRLPVITGRVVVCGGGWWGHRDMDSKFEIRLRQNPKTVSSFRSEMNVQRSSRTQHTTSDRARRVSYYH